MTTIKNVKGIILSEFKDPELRCSWWKLDENQVQMVWGYDMPPQQEFFCNLDPIKTGLGLIRYRKGLDMKIAESLQRYRKEHSSCLDFFQPRTYDLDLDPFQKAFGIIDGAYYKNICKESTVEGKKLLEKLHQERSSLLEECEQLTKDNIYLEERIDTNREMKDVKKAKIKLLNEKIECVKKEISPIKIHRLLPMAEDLLYFELRSDEGFRRVGTLSFDSEIVARYLGIHKRIFRRAYISLCQTKVCWESESQYLTVKSLIPYLN